MSINIPSSSGNLLRCSHFRAPSQLGPLGACAGTRAARRQLSVRSKHETYQVEVSVFLTDEVTFSTLMDLQQCHQVLPAFRSISLASDT